MTFLTNLLVCVMHLWKSVVVLGSLTLLVLICFYYSGIFDVLKPCNYGMIKRQYKTYACEKPVVYFTLIGYEKEYYGNKSISR
jgi:hypothetical protein